MVKVGGLAQVTALCGVLALLVEHAAASCARRGDAVGMSAPADDLVDSADGKSCRGRIAGARLQIHEGSKALEGGTEEFLVISPRNALCRDKDLDRLERGVQKAGGRRARRGRPDQGGLCVLVVGGSLDQLQTALEEERKSPSNVCS